MRYGSGTIHHSGFLDVEIDRDGDCVAVWFRCLRLPFKTTKVDTERAEEMLAAYQRDPAPSLIAVEVADENELDAIESEKLDKRRAYAEAWLKENQPRIMEKVQTKLNRVDELNNQEEFLNLEKRVAALELMNTKLGPNPDQLLALEKERDEQVAAILEHEADCRDGRPSPPPYNNHLFDNSIPPVDYSARTLTDGSPVTEDHQEIDPNTGMQKAYVVLSEEERAKGFCRPVRTSYKHEPCGTITTMGQALAETYARARDFYSSTFCMFCGDHFPVGVEGEFVWLDGSKVGE